MEKMSLRGRLSFVVDICYVAALCFSDIDQIPAAVIMIASASVKTRTRQTDNHIIMLRTTLFTTHALGSLVTPTTSTENRVQNIYDIMLANSAKALKQ